MTLDKMSSCVRPATGGAMHERIAGVEARLMKWSLVCWAGAVLAIAGLVVAAS
jgi:hypothetical protein